MPVMVASSARVRRALRRYYAGFVFPPKISWFSLPASHIKWDVANSSTTHTHMLAVQSVHCSKTMPPKKQKTHQPASAEEAEPSDEGLRLSLEQKWSLRDYVRQRPVLYQKGVQGWNKRQIRIEAMKEWSGKHGLDGNHHVSRYFHMFMQFDIYAPKRDRPSCYCSILCSLCA